MKCKHGLEEDMCGPCAREREVEPLKDAWRLTTSGEPVVALRPATRAGAIRVFSLRADNPFDVLPARDLRRVESLAADTDEHLALVREFLERATKCGLVFRPRGPLTRRETTDDGPSRCYGCRTRLSFELRTLGCIMCRQYLCRCGRCLCGQSGINYLGQAFRQDESGVPPREERLECVRVIKLCEAELHRLGKDVE